MLRGAAVQLSGLDEECNMRIDGKDAVPGREHARPPMSLAEVIWSQRGKRGEKLTWIELNLCPTVLANIVTATQHKRSKTQRPPRRVTATAHQQRASRCRP